MSILTTGRVLHQAAWYDVLTWLWTGGKERTFREKLLALVSLAPGEAVLDVGCGTGTLAIAARRHVGAAGSIVGIDASPEMIARARTKAKRARTNVEFTNAAAEALPFPNAQFDVVLSTVMLHHLPRKPRAQCVAEMRRVLKPDGRLLIVDFEGTQDLRLGVLTRLHRPRHGHVESTDVLSLLAESGLTVVRSGAVGTGDLHFALATKS